MNIEQTLWNPDDVELIGSRVGRLNINNQTDGDSTDEVANDEADESTDENDQTSEKTTIIRTTITPWAVT